MTESLTDINGIRRVYGYRTDGTVVFLNYRQVLAEYRARKLEGLEQVV